MKNLSSKIFLVFGFLALAACGGGGTFTQGPEIKGMRSFNSCSEMREVIGTALDNYVVDYDNGISPGIATGAQADGVQEDAGNAAPTADGGGAAAVVEEASLIKEEGNRLYTLSSQGLHVHDISDPKNPKKLHYMAFNLQDVEYYNQEAIEFYVWNAKVAIIAYAPVQASTSWAPSVDSTVVRVYDFSSPAQPRLISDNTLKGGYLNSRLVTDAQAASLFVITTDYRSVESLDFAESDCQRSYLPNVLEEGMASVNHLSLYGINLAGQSTAAEKPLHLFNDGSFLSDLYVSPRHLFLPLSQQWQEDSTRIFALALNALDATVRSVGDTVLSGTIKNQFDLNESLEQKTLRVVTSTNRWQAGVDSVNTLWVLDLTDAALPVRGQVSFAPPDEVVESTRMSENVAYVATAVKQLFSDPLFRIDLRDPNQPVITDDIPLAGRPGYLGVLSSNGEDQFIVSIGQDTDQVVAALFDVRTPGAVSMIEQVVVADNAGSLANSFNGHRSVTVTSDGVILIPIDAWTGSEMISQLKAYQVSEAGLDLLLNLSHDDLMEGDSYGATIRRSLEIGETLYTYSWQGIKVFEMESLLNSLVNELYREVFEDFNAVYGDVGMPVEVF